LPLPQRQIPIYDPFGVFVARPDFLYPKRKVVIQGHSFKHHGGRLDHDFDALQHNKLTALGYRILEVTNGQLTRAPHEVVAQVAAALELSLF
jgi:very-short-patch-repair endonuclease